MKFIAHPVCCFCCIVVAGCTGKQVDHEAEIRQIKVDIRRIGEAVWEEDHETVLSMTHPILFQKAGGRVNARNSLQEMILEYQKLGLKFDSFELVREPEFLETESNQYVIVPTRTIVLYKDERVELYSFQLGAKSKTDSQWKYLDGSKLTQDNIRIFFHDFPDDFEFPIVSMNLLY